MLVIDLEFIFWVKSLGYTFPEHIIKIISESLTGINQRIRLTGENKPYSHKIN